MSIPDLDLKRLKMLPGEAEIRRNWPKGELDAAVSICCITFNHEKYIADALCSFLVQVTDFPFEILVTDDASTDQTQAIIAEYRNKYPTIIKPFFHKTNQYSCGKRMNPEFNFVRAKGEYIAICEGDDYWDDIDKLQIQKTFLDENHEYVICYTDCQCINDSGVINNNFGGAVRDLSSSELQHSTPINTLTTMFRNIEFGSFEGFRGKLYGDLIIWSLLGSYGKGKFLEDIKPSIYRVHPGGIHSMKATRDKLDMRAKTILSLSIYHRDAGNNDTADYFQNELIIYGINQLRSKRPVYSKMLDFLVFRAKKNQARTRMKILTRYLKSIKP